MYIIGHIARAGGIAIDGSTRTSAVKRCRSSRCKYSSEYCSVSVVPNVKAATATEYGTLTCAS